MCMEGSRGPGMIPKMQECHVMVIAHCQGYIMAVNLMV